MTWQIFLFISIFVYSVAILTQRVLMKNEKSDVFAYSIIYQLITGIIIGLFGVFVGKISFANIQPVLFNLVLTAIFYGLANIFNFSALKLIGASEFTIIFSSRILFTIFASTFFLNEGLNAVQFVGVFLILSAVFLVTSDSKKISFKKGVVYALLGAVFFGFANTNDRFALKHMELYAYVSLGYLLPAFLTLLVSPKSVTKMRSFFQLSVFSKLILMCILYTISSITFFLALQMNANSSQTTSISLLSVIITVILSALFLKERDHLPRKVIGAILSILGSIILIK